MNGMLMKKKNKKSEVMNNEYKKIKNLMEQQQ